MSHSLDFTPSAFIKSLERIRKKFPLIRESIYADKHNQTEAFIKRISNLGPENLEAYAARMKNDELDLPLVAFRTEMGEEATEKLDILLRVRFRKKMFLLNWLILQNNYKNPKLISSMEHMCVLMKEKFPEEFNETIFSLIESWGDDPVATVLDLLEKDQITLGEFFMKYGFLEKSKFSYDLYTVYFGQADRETFTDDRESFTLAFQSYVIPQSAAVLDRYLSVFEVIEYAPEVTDFIMGKYGPIQEKSEFWNLISIESRTRFGKWTNLKALEDHFGKDSKKHQFWAYYANDIQRVELHPDIKLAFIHFDTRVVVDLGEPQQRAYLYYPETFQMEYEYFRELPDGKTKAWRIFSEQVVDARSSVIENKKSDIYQFSYEFVGRLYIKEMFKLEAQKKK